MNRERVMAGHLVNPDGGDTTVPGDKVTLAGGDWLKLVLWTAAMLGLGTSGWYGLKGDVASLKQEQGYIKEQDLKRDLRIEENRKETLETLKEINEKLDSPRFRR